MSVVAEHPFANRRRGDVRRFGRQPIGLWTPRKFERLISYVDTDEIITVPILRAYGDQLMLFVPPSWFPSDSLKRPSYAETVAALVTYLNKVGLPVPGENA